MLQQQKSGQLELAALVVNFILALLMGDKR